MADMQKNNPFIKKVYWKDIRGNVAKVHQYLAEIIDQIDPTEKFPMYLVKYPYGCQIVNKGKFFLPNKEGMLASLGSSEFSESLKSDLQYAKNHIPAGIILDRAIEIFVTHHKHVLPWFLYRAGTIFGLWGYLSTNGIFHPPKVFSITSGARSLFMLPNVGNSDLHRNLQKDFGIYASSPKGLLDQWGVFVELVRNTTTKCNWNTELLFFSNAWINHIKSDPAWHALKGYLFDLVWKRTDYWRNQMFYNFAISCAESDRNLKPNPYLADTVKHLFAIAIGAAPGFCVATNDEVAPVKFLQKAYLESYGLKDYIPTFICPTHSAVAKNNQVLYYSLQYPTTLEFSPKSRKLANTLHELTELKHITSVIVEEMLLGKLKLEETEIGKLVEDVRFSFYHNKYDQRNEIQLTKEMTARDKSLLACSVKCNNMKFADSGAFVRGCVQIYSKNNEDDG